MLTVALQLFGAACLSLGIYVLVDKNQILVLTRSVDTDSLDVPSLLESAAYALIAGGGFVFLVAFLGCCGAMKRDKCMLTVVKLFTCVIVITLLELSVVMYLLKTNELIFRSYRTRLVCMCNQRNVTLKATMALHYHGVICIVPIDYKNKTTTKLYLYSQCLDFFRILKKNYITSEF